MVKAAAGAISVRVLKGRRGMGFAGVGGGGAEVGREDSVVPAGPRGWERRLPIVFVGVVVVVECMQKCKAEVVLRFVRRGS